MAVNYAMYFKWFEESLFGCMGVVLSRLPKSRDGEYSSFDITCLHYILTGLVSRLSVLNTVNFVEKTSQP